MNPTSEVAGGESQEPKPIGWVQLTLMGWLVHVVIAGGMLSRIAMVGPSYDEKYREYHLRLPWLTEQLLGATAARDGFDPWIFGGLALLDLAILAALARWERPMWKWWFWGVLALLLVAWPAVEYILYLPTIKLRQGLSK